ncbi:unnamed protein product, partial [Bubo scandiacus]
MDVDDESSRAVYPKPHSEQLASLLKEQEKAMSDLLDEMQRLDRGSAKQAIREAYKKAHQAIRDGLKAVEESVCGPEARGAPGGQNNSERPPQETQIAEEKLREKEKRARAWVMQLLEDGEMTPEEADNYLR